ncbi:MAG: hypothetical protein IPI54_14675 [Chitinophagaceae bacterium]|nr:hypothetical protein [Chitinophagaceae bacterium]
MHDDALAGNYNIVVLYEEFADAEKKMSAREFSEKFQSDKEYRNLLFVKTDPKYSKIPVNCGNTFVPGNRCCIKAGI